jgi:hypothetical protein
MIVMEIKMTDEQKLYFGTAAQRAAMRKKHPSWKNGRKSAAKNQSKKKSTTKMRSTAKKSTTKKTTTKKNKNTVSTAGAIAIGAGGLLVGGAAGTLLGAANADSINNLLNRVAGSNNSVVAAIGKLMGGNAATNMAPIPNQTLAQMPALAKHVDNSAAASYAAYQAAIAANQATLSSYNGGLITTNQGSMRTQADILFDQMFSN